MVSVQYSNALAEVLHYLKGIRKEDIDKIPKKFMEHIRQNASKEYECNFDYNRPLKDLNLLNETRGIIGMICYNYWCETEEQKKKYLNHLDENEALYEKDLREKYNPDNLFKNTQKRFIEEQTQAENIAMVKYEKETFIDKIKRFFINIFKK